MAITPENYWPLGSTVQGTKQVELTSTYYEHFGFVSVNPVDGHMVLLYRKANLHVGDQGTIWIRHSTNGGDEWSDEEQAIPAGPNNYDQRNLGGGFDSNGRLFLFYTIYNQGSGSFVSLVYKYNDNNGYPGVLYGNWIAGSLPLPTHTKFSPYGQLIDVGNGVLYQTWYENDYTGLPPSGNLLSCSYRLNVLKSIDGGISFSNINIYDHTNSGEQFLYTEFSLVNVGGGCFILLARKDGLDFQEFQQFKSENNCQTWTPQGDTPAFIDQSVYPAPPWLSFINYEGVGIVACYYTNRGSRLMNVVYGLAKNLLENGTSGWIETTKRLILNYSVPPPVSTLNVGYQYFFLPLNQYKGVGVGFKEIDNPNPPPNYFAYPVVVFTSTESMNNVLLALGL